MTTSIRKNPKKLSCYRILNPEVAAVFRAYPRSVRPTMRSLRSLIIETAEKMVEVGELEETLKWGEPSYLTSETKFGSTIRIDWKPKNANNVAIYFKCTTDLVQTFKKRFKDAFTYEGNRAILLELEAEIPRQQLQLCVALALTYHRHKKLSTKTRWKLIEELLVS